MFLWVFSWIDVALFLLVIVGLLYYYGTSTFGFFDKRGIKSIKPYPYIGNMLPLVLGKEHMNAIVEDIYYKFKDEKICGVYNFTTPTLIVKDLELIKRITIKDFDHFTDHLQIPSEADPLFFNNVFSMRGEKWHNMRCALSPAFTGSKMREMMPFIAECSKRFIGYLKKEVDSSVVVGKDYMEIEMKGLMSKVTNDVIMSCAFGVLSDSLNDPDNELYTMTKKLTNIELKDALKLLSTVMFPRLRKVMNVKLVDDSITNFYRSLVMDIIKQRNKSGLIRRDMIHLLMMAMKGSLHEEDAAESPNEDIGFATVQEELKGNAVRVWTDDEITAQAVVFIFAGFEGTSTVLSFMCYELANNPGSQTKLREEIDHYIAESDEMIKYNDIRSLAYMDMVLSETLRLWPPGGVLDRQCVKEYTLPVEINNQTYTIEKDDLVWIPVHAIHRDPQYYPDPDKFIPERFSEENKGNIKPGSFLPFGIGPRSCVGNRFALVETKIIMFHLLANFEIVQTPKTEIPLKVKSHAFNLHGLNGTWVGLKRRQK